MADSQSNTGALAEGVMIQGPQGQYRVEAVLNRGPQMTTVRASDSQGVSLVLKELRLEALHSWKVMELFERESKILSQLDHDCLPRLVDAFRLETEAQTRFYLVCSWAEGESLLDRLNAGWCPQPDEIQSIARQSLELLAYLQAFNPPIIHRDIKPANLILDEGGRLHLVDFGAVQGLLNPDGGSTVVGTFGYMPPEQFSDRCVPASDLYALGATLGHLLSGKFPSDLPRKGLRLDYGPLPSDSALSAAWLDRLLAPELEARFRSAREALDALDDSLCLLPVSASPSRINLQRRGAQLNLRIEPAGLLNALDWPARLAVSWFSLSWIWQMLFADHFLDRYFLRKFMIEVGGFSYDQISTFFNSYSYNLLSELVPVYHLGILAQTLATLFLVRSLVSASIQTTISLQPERYTIRYSLGKLAWSAQGASSELLRLQRRGKSWLRSRSSRLIERSGHSLPGPGQLTPSQHRELTSALAGYLQDFSPERAQALREASHEAEPGLRPRSAQAGLIQRGLTIRALPTQVSDWKGPADSLRAALHRLSESYLPRQRYPWLYRELLPERLQLETTPTGLTLRFDDRSRILAWLTGISIWIPSVSSPWLKSIVASHASGLEGFQKALLSGWYFDVTDAQVQLDLIMFQLIAWFMCNLILVAGLNRFLLAGLNQRELQVRPSGLALKHRLGLPGRRESLLPVERWREVTYKRRWGRYTLYAYEAGGQQHRLADGLSRSEAIAISRELSDGLRRAQANTPAELDASLQSLLEARKPRWRKASVLMLKQPEARLQARLADSRVIYRAMYGLWQSIRQKLRAFGSLRRGLSQRG